MLSKLLSTSTVILLSTGLAAAQTSSLCNPVKGQSCAPDVAFAGTYTIDFTKGASDLFTLAGGTTLKYDATKGAAFTIAEEGNAPTIASTKYLFFGTVEAVIQAAPGTGIVTSFVMQSDDLDEIDWEWLGGDTAQVQTNYFSKGDTSTYDRGGFSKVNAPQSSFHTYTIDWSPEALVWSIDGVAVRTLAYKDAHGGTTFPQTPMQIKLGTWDAGASTQPAGTVEWAGGRTPFGAGSGAPYTAYYKSLKITDRSNGVAGATSYEYVGTSGTYDNIKVNTDGSSSNSTSTTKSSTKSSTSSTKSGSQTANAATGSKTTDTTLATTTTGKSTATGSSATTTSSASKTSNTATVATNGVSKMGTSLAGAVGAMAAALALL